MGPLGHQATERRAEAPFNRAAHPDGIEAARALGHLGAVLSDRGNPGEGEPLLREALAAKLELIGPTASETSTTQRELAHCLTLLGRTAEAESLLLEAYRRLEQRSDFWSGKERRETLRRLVDLYRETGRAAEAAKYRQLLVSTVEP